MSSVAAAGPVKAFATAGYSRMERENKNVKPTRLEQLSSPRTPKITKGDKTAQSPVRPRWVSFVSKSLVNRAAPVFNRPPSRPVTPKTPASQSVSSSRRSSNASVISLVLKQPPIPEPQTPTSVKDDEELFDLSKVNGRLDVGTSEFEVEFADERDETIEQALFEPPSDLEPKKQAKWIKAEAWRYEQAGKLNLALGGYYRSLEYFKAVSALKAPASFEGRPWRSYLRKGDALAVILKIMYLEVHLNRNPLTLDNILGFPRPPKSFWLTTYERAVLARDSAEASVSVTAKPRRDRAVSLASGLAGNGAEVSVSLASTPKIRDDSDSDQSRYRSVHPTVLTAREVRQDEGDVRT